MLSIGISPAKQTEAMYGAECNKHSSRKTPCLTERKSEAAERIWTWQILVITQWCLAPTSSKRETSLVSKALPKNRGLST